MIDPDSVLLLSGDMDSYLCVCLFLSFILRGIPVEISFTRVTLFPCPHYSTNLSISVQVNIDMSEMCCLK